MKKFWEKVSIKKISSDSFCVMLDKRILKTPLKRDLVLPNLNLAQEIVKEWDQDSKNINTESMIFYGLISTSLDKIIDNKNLYINDILDYIDTDLICYRAENPKELVELQKNKWDPIILLLEKYIGSKVEVFQGVLPKKQHEQSKVPTYARALSCQVARGAFPARDSTHQICRTDDINVYLMSRIRIPRSNLRTMCRRCFCFTCPCGFDVQSLA